MKRNLQATTSAPADKIQTNKDEKIFCLEWEKKIFSLRDQGRNLMEQATAEERKYTEHIQKMAQDNRIDLQLYLFDLASHDWLLRANLQQPQVGIRPRQPVNGQEPEPHRASGE